MLENLILIKINLQNDFKIEERTRERIEKNLKIRLFKSVLWNIKPVELKIFIKDILESQVDQKYYLSGKLQERFEQYLKNKESKIVAMRSYPRTGTNDVNRTQNLEPRDDGCSNTLTNVQKDNLVLENSKEIQGIQLDISGKGHRSE